jgi:CRP/FNR family transcriptional regulator
VKPTRKRRKLPPPAGPTIRAGGLFGPSTGTPVTQLLTDRQRQQLASVASVLRLTRRSLLYRADDPANSVWFIGSGVVKSYRELANGKRQIMAFLFASDVFGLAENGCYVNTTRAVTDVILYRIPAVQLTEILKRDPELEFQFLCKVVHELRELQRRAIAVARRDAAGRLAKFLSILSRSQAGPDIPDGVIDVPMSRTDIAEFLNLTPEAISRAIAQLARDGIVSFPNRQSARILDAAAFDRLVSDG